MLLRFGLAALATAAALFASADKKLPIEKSSNELVEISASLLDKDQVVKEFGSDLGGYITVVRVSVRPLTEKPVKIEWDDFFLLSTADGQRSTPFAPSQIAGASSLVVTPQGTRRGGMMGDSAGPIWGGYPGSTTRPQRLPGNGGGIGNAAGETTNDATVKTDKSAKDNPVLLALKEKVLPEKETDNTITGLLYFQIEGKVKPKDLELHYKTPAGRLALRFRP